MACAVIISHPSEIIRKGVFSILENEVNATILCFEKLCDIKEHLFATYSDMVFILPHKADQSNIFTKLKKNHNKIIVVRLDSKISTTAHQHFDFLFNINTPARELVQQIKNYLSESNASFENEELTGREKEVLRLIALGYTNKSIAETLYISTHTVISHRKNITDKLGIKSIPGLTVYAIIKKIVTQDDITRTQRS